MVVDDLGTRELSYWQGQARDKLERDGIDAETEAMALG